MVTSEVAQENLINFSLVDHERMATRGGRWLPCEAEQQLDCEFRQTKLKGRMNPENCPRISPDPYLEMKRWKMEERVGKQVEVTYV